MKGTPIGNTKFDLYNFGGKDYANVNFDYIFDGMIFYKPVKEFVLKIGIPNIYPKELEKQFFFRASLSGNQTLEEAMNDEEILKELKIINTPVETTFEKEGINTPFEQIRKWIK